MTRLAATAPPPALRTGLRRASQCYFHYRAEPADWTLQPLSGQALLTPTSLRGGTGWGLGSDGGTYPMTEDLPRFEWFDADGDGILERPALLCEDTSTNLCGFDDALSSWSVSGSAAATSLGYALGDCALWRVNDQDGAAAAHVFRQLGTFTGLTVKGVLLLWGKGLAPAASGSWVRLRDITAGVNRLDCTITVSGNTPVPAIVGGAGVFDGLRFVTRRFGIDWYLIALASNAIANTSNVHQLQIGGAVTAAQTGDLHVGGVLVENEVRPSSRIETPGSGNVTRAREVIGWSAPLVPEAADETWCVDLFETGGIDVDGAIVAALTGSTGAAPYFAVTVSSGLYTASYHNGTSSVSSQATVTPAYGARVRLLAERYADGSVRIGQSVNGGAVIYGTKSAALASSGGVLWGGGASPGYYLQPTSGFNKARTRLAEWWAAPGILSEAQIARLW